MAGMGWTKKATAQTMWCTTKKKLLAFTGGDGDEDAPLPLAKGKGKKRTGGAEDVRPSLFPEKGRVLTLKYVQDDERKDSASPGPATKKQKKQSKSKAKEAESSDDGDEATTIPPRPIKRARKPKPASFMAKAVGMDESSDGESAKVVKNEPKEDEEEDVADDFLAELNAYAERASS